MFNIANYTNLSPVIQINKVAIAQGRAGKG